MERWLLNLEWKREEVMWISITVRPPQHSHEPNFSKIEQSMAELQRFKDWKYRGQSHLGFHGRWISITVPPQWTHNAPINHISMKLNNLHLSCSTNSMDPGLMSNFNVISQCKAELLTIQPIFTAWFLGEQFYSPYFSMGLWRGHVTQFWNFGILFISWERLKLETSNLSKGVVKGSRDLLFSVRLRSSYARYCDRLSVCLSVCLPVRPSVKRVYCDKTKAPNEKVQLW